MGGNRMRSTCCFSSARHDGATAGAVFSSPLDEGLGHSFCYIRPPIQSSNSSIATDNSFSISQSSDEPPLSQTSDPTPEKSFKSISGASVSANAANNSGMFHSLPINPSDRAAAFNSTSSFTALPLQPAPRGLPYSGSIAPPLSLSCPLDRTPTSGSPSLDRAAGTSGPLERGFMSGPLERTHISGSYDPISSAQTQNLNKRRIISRLARGLTRPVKKALTKTFSGVFARKTVPEGSASREIGSYAGFSRDMGSCPAGVDAARKANLQWAQAMAGEDRVHIVLCEDHGWLFVGIYDGFNGPDAADFLMSNLYPEIYRQLKRLLWDQSQTPQPTTDSSNNHKKVSANEILGMLNSWKKYLNAANGDARAAEFKAVGVGATEAGVLGMRHLKPHRDASVDHDVDFQASVDHDVDFQASVDHYVDFQASVDHYVVLKALSRALKATESAYLAMADRAAAENPELALVGSCVLVMLMKDEDVYIMNVGDSRALLASQKARSDPSDASNLASKARSHGQFNGGKEDHDRISARDSMLRRELERIIEETPMELEEQPFDPSRMTPPAISPSLDASQLTSDHSTNIQQEVIRIMMEHPDDGNTFYNDRVKGRLKVTRAFGAGFLKNPKWNDALLEMFRINYVGTAPYINCVPAMHHHKLGPQDRFLVLSSDGLYQYLTNEEAIAHVEWFMEKFPEGDPAQYLIEELLFRAAKKAGMDFHELLEIQQGDRRKYHDDVSVMVISVEGRVWRSSS